MNSDGSNQTRLSNFPDSVRPHWSPDGTKIIFHNPVDVYVINADGTNLLNLTNGAGGNVGGVEPAWSPDGSKIAFSSDRVDPTHYNYEIYVMNADGSNQTRLTYSAAYDTSPDW